MSSTKRKQNKPQRSLEQCELEETSDVTHPKKVQQWTRRSTRIVSKRLARSPTPPATSKTKKKPPTPSKKINAKKKILQPNPSMSKLKNSKTTDDGILNVDILRRLPVSELMENFSVHTTKAIPKDHSSTIIQHEYSCQMMPHNCREVFCGSESDTKEEICRHLLRHIGELLTLTNLDPDSKKAKNSVTIATVKRQSSADGAAALSSDDNIRKEPGDEDEQGVTKQGRRSQRILEKVLHDGKPHDDTCTIIHSEEGVNEIVVLPKGKLINLSSAEQTDDQEELTTQKQNTKEITKQSPKYTLRQSPNVLNLPISNVVDLPKEEVKLGRPPKSLQRNISSENIDVRIIDGSTVENYLSEEIDADKIGAEIVVQTYMQTADDIITAMQAVPFTPPNTDHLYALLPCKPLPVALHTDSSGVPIPEPEHSGEESQEPEEAVDFSGEEVLVKPSTDIDSVEIVTDFDMESVCQDIGFTKGKKRRKQDPQLTVINYELFQHLTPDERRIRKQALELLYQSRKRSRIKKGELLECEICGKMLTAFGTLRAHYRSHAGIKPYSCKVCSATFTRLHSLKYHMMIHNDQSRFTCEHCRREFRHASHFREHLRRHTGEEPFGCTECSARFKTRNTYKRHLYAKHGKVLKTDGIHLAKVHQTINKDNIDTNGIPHLDQTVNETTFKDKHTLLLPTDAELANFAQQIEQREQDLVLPNHDDTEDIATCLASLSEITNPLKDMEGNIRILLI